jgi:DNA-binding CsgD family transcriptional regulator
MQVFIENQTYPFFDKLFISEAKIQEPGSLPIDGFSTKGGSTWRAKLDAIALESSLSPRQKEVMGLLAKGRDAGYIMKHFVISRSTAKTHVYNLYRRLGIHSRQELLDLIENAHTDDEATPQSLKEGQHH